jgi:predicted TPR repeat methyltransferase
MRVLRPGGLFCFTIELDEANENSGMTAVGSMRILHGSKATENLLTDAGFLAVRMDAFVMRVEAGSPVNSALCSGAKRT